MGAIEWSTLEDIIPSWRNSSWPVLLVLALLAMNIYRAWAQPITTDEAFTYNLYVDGPASKIFTYYDANNHVLHTILCRMSVKLFGLSEFTMRIPSLLGGLFYLITTL